MSSHAGQSFGTNSPPLDATGQDKPMGVSSISGDKPASPVPDVEQRQGYFKGVETGKENGDQVGAGAPSQKAKQ